MMAIYAAFAVSLLLFGQPCDAMGPFSLNDILAATNGRATGCDDDIVFSGISTDSRTIQRNQLFWALPGPNHDGHAWIPEARKGGATAVVSQRSDNFGPTITVDDTLNALHRFAEWHRSQQDALVIGITGSFGKTTTREMVYAVLSESHNGLRSPFNYNNYVGVPLTLLSMDSSHEFAVVELGASSIGEIKHLAQMAKPEIGILTGIGPAHLDGFGDIKQITRAKSELLQALPQSGFAVIAGDDPIVRTMVKTATCPVILVGESNDNTIRATNVSTSHNTVSFAVDSEPFEFTATGRHHVQAALIAIAIGREIGLSTKSIQEGLARFQPVAGRCELRTIGEWNVIDDTYNANPTSMRAACNVLKEWNQPGQKILIAGDMLELGTESAAMHQTVGEFAAASNVDKLITFGETDTTVADAAIKSGLRVDQVAACDTIKTIHTVLDCWLEPGDVVLIKGSRSLRMERVVEWLEQRARKDLHENTIRTSVRACA